MNSILLEVDPASLANEIRMHKSRGMKAVYESFLLVEGHSDLMFLQKFVSRNDCLIMIGVCRENVIGAVLILDGDGVSGVVGLIDKDFGAFFPPEELSENVVCTDENDAEMMILCSPALDQILIHYGKEKKIAGLRTATGKEPRSMVFEQASRIGAVRVVSRREEWNLKFAGVSFCYESNASIEIDFESQCNNILIGPTDKEKPALQELMHRANELLEGTEEARLLCRGHDCIRILRRAIRYLFGTTSEFDSDKREKGLENVLRLAYDQVYFQKTHTYSEMRRWEQRNHCKIFNWE